MKILKSNMINTKKIEVIFFLLAVLLMILSYGFMQSIIIKTELEYFTTELSKDTKDNVVSAQNLLDGMVQELEYTANIVQKYDDLWDPEVKKILKFSNKMNNFDVTFISDAEGNAYYYKGNEFNVADQPYFKKAIKENNVVFSNILPSKKYDAIQIIAKPLYTETKEIKGVLFGLFDIETISRLINNVVDYDKYIYIVDSNGNYINCFDENLIMPDVTNYWDDMALRELHDTTIDKLKSDFNSRKEGGFSYSYKGIQRYGYHMPIGVQDWQIVLTVENTVMNSHINSIKKIKSIDSISNALCLAVMIICVHSYFKKTHKEIQSANQKIIKNNEMIRMAVEFTDHIIFEYSINERKIELKTKISNSLFNSQVISNVPECFIEKDMVIDSSIAELRKLFDSITTNKSSQADIQVISGNNEKVWYRISMNNIYDETGKIVGTVGSAIDINILKKGEAAIKRKEETRKTLIANALLYVRVDLSIDTVIEINGIETHISYQDYLHKKIMEYVIEEHQAYVAQALSLETLNRNYSQSKDSVGIQFIAKDGQSTKWISCMVYRIHMSDSSRVSFIITDIDRKKRQEIALKEQAERDGLTGLYNAVTARSKINEILSSNDSSEENHVFILFDLDNFKQINDTFGHACGDQVLIDISNLLKHHFRSYDIIARLGGDEFVIMLCNIKSETLAEESVKELTNILVKTYTQDNTSVKVSASIGMAIAPRDGSTFEELYKKADCALYEVKKGGKSGYKRFK